MASIEIPPNTQVFPNYTGVAGSAPTAYNGPLAPMYSTSTKLNLFMYPSDLTTQTKSHYVKFWIKEILGTGVNKSGNKISIFGFPDLYTNPQTIQSKSIICLYMPDTMTATYNASYDELSLMNDLGNIKGLQTIEQLATAAGDKVKSNYNSVDAKAVEFLKSLGASALSGSAATGDVYLAGGGITINPQLQMIYRGVGFREFQLTFNFTPTSQDEAKTVNDIIGQFKYHFAPELGDTNGGAISMFMTPPSIFDIEFMFGDSANMHLPKYGDCVLTNIDVNYAPNGFAAFNDGAPVQTQLNLTFKEMEIVTKSKLQKGFNDSSTNKSGALR